jgi:hypothetical protein
MFEIAQKPPMDFHVLRLAGVFAVWPPVHIAQRGGNSVLIRNHTDSVATVRHDGHLSAPDPFEVAAQSKAGPYPVAPEFDVPGHFALQITVDNVRLESLAARADPEIIIT